MRHVFALLAAMLLAAVGSGMATAQSLQGMAIAHSAEEGFHACHDGNPAPALNCARQKCRKAGGAACMRVRWCFPAG